MCDPPLRPLSESTRSGFSCKLVRILRVRTETHSPPIVSAELASKTQTWCIIFFGMQSLKSHMSNHVKHNPPAQTKEKEHASPPTATIPTAAPDPRRFWRSSGKWTAWLGGGTAIALATLVVGVFPTESHDFARAVLHSPFTVWSLIKNRIVPGERETLDGPPKRYTTFNITGSFQQGYSIDKESTILIDGETGYEMDANITVLGPNNSKETFTAKPNYGIESVYQWQNQGSLGGSLDFQFKPRTFAGFTGGRLTNSAYWTPALNHNIDSSDTSLRPIATSEDHP